VDVDEAGHKGVSGEVDDAIARFGGRGCGGGDGGDLFAVDDDGLRGGLFAGVDVKDFSGAAGL
jgi:hypothetical protein